MSLCQSVRVAVEKISHDANESALNNDGIDYDYDDWHWQIARNVRDEQIGQPDNPRVYGNTSRRESQASAHAKEVDGPKVALHGHKLRASEAAVLHVDPPIVDPPKELIRDEREEHDQEDGRKESDPSTLGQVLKITRQSNGQEAEWAAQKETGKELSPKHLLQVLPTLWAGENTPCEHRLPHEREIFGNSLEVILWI